ncbi:ABC transporter permease [Brytella acorum]|uniref:ABC transporter permease n=1 Tax=Brytella acorum TaxID=2959299 RepID=A0AA35VBR7_9PROT|nr:ABC transporter permease [Brytella acorum]MDF3623386.1 ABC transporter permease [Brytella acorum]CAI9120492.1 ABC transporter permease [Brytella acorum]
MLGHIALAFWRGIMRRRLFTALNVLGMALGMATFLTLALIVRYEFSFNRWIPDAGNIYRLDAYRDHEASVSSIRLLDAVRAEHPDWRATAIPRGFSNATVLVHGVATDLTIARTDAHFFDVFELPLIEGERARALVPDGVVLTQSLARRFFGTDHGILGRTFEISQKGQRRQVHVTAVLKDMPSNTTPYFDVIVPSSSEALHGYNLWQMNDTEVWVRLSPSVAAQLPTLLKGLVQRHAAGLSADEARPYVVQARPLDDVHFFDATIGWGGTDERLPIIVGVIGVLALLAGLINFVNLSTALAATRARDVAMRKVLGATPRMLALSFTGEAIGLALLAACLALVPTELALPWIATLSGWPVRLDFSFALPLLLLAAIIGGACAGAYPSWLLSRFRPAAVLASARLPGSSRLGSRLREGLVVIQFAFAIALTICTVVIWRQTHLLQTMDRGFRQSGLLVDILPDDPSSRQRQQRLVDALRGVPGIADVTLSDDAPGGGSAGLSYDAKRPGRQTSVFVGVIGTRPSALPVFGAHLVAGRLFDAGTDHDSRPMPIAPFDANFGASDFSFGAHNVVLNEAAVRALGFPDAASALGQPIFLQGKTAQTVIGVVADMRLRDSRSVVAPALYYAVSGPIGHGVLSIRFDHAPENAVRDAVAVVWKQVFPEATLNLRSVEEIVGDDTRPEQQRGTLMIIASLLTLFISCVGLYGIAAFNVQRRLFEIGVRKVLGATAGQVMRLLVFQFLRPVLLANCLAWPVAWWAMRVWLAGFDQRISLSPFYFLGTALTVAMLAVVTTLLQARKGAWSAPSVALGSP